jgi:hypothetical protein
MCSGRGDRPLRAVRFPHSEIPGSVSGCRLPRAYRRLLRPSSAPGAKASAVCPYQLGNYLQMLASTMQFSRYGRSQPPSRRVPRSELIFSSKRGRSAGGRSWPREARTPVPSGPNSVLDPFTVRHGVPPASGCTNHDDPMYEPNNQCSTSEQPARISAGVWGSPPRSTQSEHGSGQVETALCRLPASCSLERR